MPGPSRANPQLATPQKPTHGAPASTPLMAAASRLPIHLTQGTAMLLPIAAYRGPSAAASRRNGICV